RYSDYLASDGFTTLNVISSVGAAILGLSTLPWLYNVYRTWRFAPTDRNLNPPKPQHTPQTRYDIAPDCTQHLAGKQGFCWIARGISMGGFGFLAGFAHAG
ncbi:MAG: hypothetical protein O2960_30865, partial [Verrucomicrobia bacterium]|nr:hypothetical protein [Verrucomicrobiota bacterium]